MTFYSCSELTSLSYPTITMFDRFCVPSESALVQKISSLFSGFNIEDMLESAVEAKWIILLSVLTSFVVAFIFSFLLEYCATLIVFLTVTGFYAGLGFIICFSWAKQAQQDAILAKDANNQEAIKSKKFWRLIFWVAITLVFVTTCVVCCMISRIVLAIKVIQVSHEKAK